MKPIFVTLLVLFVSGFLTTADAQQNAIDATSSMEAVQNIEEPVNKKHLNFFVVSKRKKGKLDLATRFNVLRGSLKSLFRKKLTLIVASDAREMSGKIRRKLHKHDARIGTLWFDSHGMYKKGYSLFTIGKDEMSYKTLKDPAYILPLVKLSPWTDSKTKIVIGSCYGGATYTRASIDYKDTTRMNGDSLMIALGELFQPATIYGSESWVMTKPGLFRKKPAVVGFPGRKLFLDYCYQPAWEKVGKWNQYNSSSNHFSPVNPVSLDRKGNLKIIKKSPAEQKEMRSKVHRNLGNLGKGLYK